MDDAVICGQLSQIFPQVEPNVIQRIVEEAKTNQGVDILSHCIEVVLARQEEARWLGNNNGQQGNADDVVVVKSIKKETSRKGKTRDIPLVYVNEDRPGPLEFRSQSETPQPFSDYDSDSTHSGSFPDYDSYNDELDLPVRYMNKNNYFEQFEVMSSPIRDELSDDNLDKLITNFQSPPLAVHPQTTPASELTPAVKMHMTFDKKQYLQPLTTVNLQPSETPVRHPSETPVRQSSEISFMQPKVRHPSETPIRQSSKISIQRPKSILVQQPNSIPAKQPKSILVEQPKRTLVRQTSATPTRQPSAMSSQQHSSTPIKQSSATPLGKPSVTPNQQNTPSSTTTSMSMASSLLDFVKQMFPKVNVEFVQNLSQQGYDLNGIVNMLIDQPKMQNSGPSEKPPSPKEPVQIKEIDYFTNFSQEAAYGDQWPCQVLLRNEFQRIPVNDIRKAMHMCNDHYAPTRKLLEEALLNMNQNQRSKSPMLPQNSASLQNSMLPTTSISTQKRKFTITRLLTSKRPLMKCIGEIHPELQLEIDFVKKQAMLKEEKKNAIYAAHLNKQQYMAEGELIECGCCFGEFPFEEIVQCSNGHLFCKECLHGYAKEIIFGSAMAFVKLVCMGEDCDQPFPYNQLEKCLTKDEIEKYQGRLQEDCLAKADIPNLHQCPFCEFAAIVPEQQKVFTCMNSKCLKESCTECKEEWKEHFGKKCNEIEKKSQTNLRLSYEERMTVAKVRKCAKCSLTFTKLDGCNKMTCRCGTTQCYVCRKSAINYDHFCRHPRDPGKKCQKCTACSLWTDPTEDDELAIKQLQEEAVAAKRKLMEEIEQSTSKKQKV